MVFEAFRSLSSQPQSPSSSHPTSCPHSSSHGELSPASEHTGPHLYFSTSCSFCQPGPFFPPPPCKLHFYRYLGICLASLDCRKPLKTDYLVSPEPGRADTADNTLTAGRCSNLFMCFAHISIHKVGSIITPILQLRTWRQRGKLTYENITH